MAEDKKKEIDVTVIEVTEEYLKEKLYKIRGKRVLLDADLAEIYGYDTKCILPLARSRYRHRLCLHLPGSRSH